MTSKDCSLCQKNNQKHSPKHLRSISYQQNREQGRTMLMHFFVQCVLLLFSVWMIGFVLFGFAVQKGMAMFPVLSDGDLCCYNRLDIRYDVDEIVFYHLPIEIAQRYETGEQTVPLSNFARVVAVGGDIVELTAENQILVNGTVINGNTCETSFDTENRLVLPYEVPANTVFLLVDACGNHADSRLYGAVPIDCIMGTLCGALRKV